MFELALPWILLFAPLPVLIWYALPAARTSPSAALWVPDMQQFGWSSHEARDRQTPLAGKSIILPALIWLLLLFAAAQPQWLGEPVKLPLSGRDLMLAVDLSASMQEQDMLINGEYIDRLSAVKIVASQFIENRRGDRLGLILFADHAYLQTPFTHDTHTVKQMLLEAELGLAGEKTAIGDAIAMAVKRIKDLSASESQSRVIILLTDGANTAGVQPLKMAQFANKLGIKIYTIGIGADQITVRTIFGRRNINPSRDLDETMLKQMAQLTGGRYFRATDTRTLAEIYQTIDQIEPIITDNEVYRPVEPLYYYPLALALLLSFFLAFKHAVARGV